MRLSTAIRLGVMLKPQAFGGYHKDGGSCALGAAFDAIGVAEWSPGIGFDAPFGVDYFDDEKEVIRCPVCLVVEWPVAGHINDAHRWTRERIADWVETVEAEQEETCQYVSMTLQTA